MRLQYQLANGNWVDVNAYSKTDRTDEFLARCMENNRISGDGKINDRATYAGDRTMTRDEVIAALVGGETLRNDRGDWYSNCRDGEFADAKAAKLLAAARAADKRPVLRCQSCGATGHAGAYPFSTLPGSGRCDDCV